MKGIIWELVARWCYRNIEWREDTSHFIVACRSRYLNKESLKIRKSGVNGPKTVKNSKI